MECSLHAVIKDKQLSRDAKIESFTFDTSVEANQIVRSQPELSGMAYSFVVYPWADGEAMAALVPAIVVSQGATRRVDPMEIMA